MEKPAGTPDASAAAAGSAQRRKRSNNKKRRKQRQSKPRLGGSTGFGVPALIPAERTRAKPPRGESSVCVVHGGGL